MFAQLFVERKETFFQTVQRDRDERAELWDALSQSPALQFHPILKPSDLEHTIPLGLHGDGGQFSHQDSFFVITWNSLVGQGTTRENRFPITCTRKSDLLRDGSTLESIFKIISWSLNTMLQGATPTHDADGMPLDNGGQPLAGPWRGACIQVRGDWQFFCQAFNFPQWNSHVRMCWLCRASNIDGRLCWTNFNSNAPWRGTAWSHESYLADLASRGADAPSLFNIVGLRVECVMVDILHCVDLGVAGQVVGNALYEVLPKLGPNRDKQVLALNRRLQQWYSDSNV